MEVTVKVFLVLCLIQATLAESKNIARLSARITNGHDAEPGEFPHQLSIESTPLSSIPYNHICGGTILSEYFVLTAAHCVGNVFGLPLLYRIKAGKHEFKADDGNVQTIKVAKKFVHEGYRQIGAIPKATRNDIALLKLERPLVFDDRVQPAMLPVANSERSGEAVISGWGSVSNNENAISPKVLQTASVPIIDFKSCTFIIKNLPGTNKLFDTMLCTGPIGGSVSTCMGDFGGPLVQYENNSTVIIGVSSWGYTPCGTLGAPSIFTKVSSYIDWINEKMKML